jgi:hypothetical protein
MLSSSVAIGATPRRVAVQNEHRSLLASQISFICCIWPTWPEAIAPRHRDRDTTARNGLMPMSRCPGARNGPPIAPECDRRPPDAFSQGLVRTGRKKIEKGPASLVDATEATHLERPGHGFIYHLQRCTGPCRVASASRDGPGPTAHAPIHITVSKKIGTLTAILDGALYFY